MAKANFTTTSGISAGAYIRMSGRQQDKSPAEQPRRSPNLPPAKGAPSSSGSPMRRLPAIAPPPARPGLAALLTAARAGTFKVVLAWHTNRISREDPMDAIVFYNQLRKVGVGLHTCCEGAIDLEDFAKQLLLFINQKASNDFLVEMSAKTLRGRIANAKAGGHNGGPAVYAMDRGLFNGDGRLVRRLQPGEYVRQAGHRVHLLPCTDQTKIDAVQFAFTRFDRADLGVRDLARELEAKGYPSPTGKGWTHHNIPRLLENAAYVGTARWGNGVGQVSHGPRGRHCFDQRQRQVPRKATEALGRRHSRRGCPRGHNPHRLVQSCTTQAAAMRED